MPTRCGSYTSMATRCGWNLPSCVRESPDPIARRRASIQPHAWRCRRTRPLISRSSSINWWPALRNKACSGASCHPQHPGSNDTSRVDAPKLSACIITLNEADRIEACLQALDFCDEVIVVDAHSSDATRTIAMRLGARVIERDWPGYRSQKQFATDAASHDWVLSVDADERVTPALRAEIIALRSRGFANARGWSIARLTEYFGRFLRHGNA